MMNHFDFDFDSDFGETNKYIYLLFSNRSIETLEGMRFQIR